MCKSKTWHKSAECKSKKSCEALCFAQVDELHTSVLHCTLCPLIHLLDAGDSVLISYLIWMNLFLCFLFPILIEKICVFQTLKTVFAHISKHIVSLPKISLPVISKSGQHGRTCLIYHQCFRQTVPLQESRVVKISRQPAHFTGYSEYWAGYSDC